MTMYTLMMCIGMRTIVIYIVKLVYSQIFHMMSKLFIGVESSRVHMLNYNRTNTP